MAVNLAQPQTHGSLRRKHGRYYTPALIARDMFETAWHAATKDRGAPLRILDLACGEGVFLLAAFDRLLQERESTWTNRLAIVRDQLFGVDIDAEAVKTLRQQLVERIAPPAKQLQLTIQTVACNIRVGDALTGPEFRRSSAVDSRVPCPRLLRGHVSTSLDPAHAHPKGGGHGTPVDFADAFPAIAVAGGFDIVIGNPPYRRELDAQPEFARLAESPLGKRWRQARMDLWYYFLHRGLDVLRPGGVLSYIVNSYWTSSSGARLVIERLKQDTTLEHVVLLGDALIFPDVTGKHLIFQLRASRTESPCRVFDSDDSYDLAQSEVFQHGRIVLSRPPRWIDALSGLPTLGEFFEVRQGMAENPPSINRKTADRFPGEYRVGEGVFVLTDDECAQLQLTPREMELLRPYYRTADISRYAVATTMRSVIYLSKATATSLDGLPNIAAHLERFRPILERRREVRAGKIAWWHLHWPREERIFADPRILAAQMGQTPRFAFASAPTFVGFSTNIILVRSPEAIRLPALTGILNSQFAAEWFDRYAKKRGINIEISGETLRRFPLPVRNTAIEQQLVQVARDRLDATIDDMVERLYGLKTIAS